jgi:hypothetical protein
VSFFYGSNDGTSSRIISNVARYKYSLLAVGIVMVSCTPLVAQALQSSTPSGGSLYGSTHMDMDDMYTAISEDATRQAPSESTQAAEPKDTTTTSVSGTSSTNQSSVELTVNGQDIPVPQNGTVTKTITDDNSQTVINVQATNASTGDSTDRNKLRVRSSTRTSTSVNTHSTQQVTEKGELQQ